MLGESSRRHRDEVAHVQSEAMVELACSDCGDVSVLEVGSLAAVHEDVAAFFSVHPRCHTTIDLSRAPELRFPQHVRLVE
jgi:hypothetical protein